MKNDQIKDGVFMIVEVTSKKPDEQNLSASRLSVNDFEGHNYNINNKSEALMQMKLKNYFEAPFKWEFEGSITIPGSRTVKLLLHVPCSEPIDAHSIEIRSENDEDPCYVFDTDDREWETLRGLPDRVDEWLTQFKYEQ